MKNIIILAIIGLLLASCNEIEIKTVVNPDGSCYRELTSNIDRKYLNPDSISKHNPFPVEIDSIWTLSWSEGEINWENEFPVFEKFENKTDSSKENKDSTNYKIRIKKHFSSVENMGKEYVIKDAHPWKDLKIDYQLVKKFRWFYTYYEYKETYHNPQIKFENSIDEFLTKDEYLFWFTGQPNLTSGMSGMEAREYLGEIENKYEKWMLKNMWAWEYDYMLSNYDKIPNITIEKEKLIHLKDSIFESKVKKNLDFKMDDILDSFFITSIFSRFWNEESSPMKDYQEDSDAPYPSVVSLLSESFDYSLILPGNIKTSNSAKTDGNKMIWNLSAYRFLVNDYVIEAESQKVNIWAFIVTGIIVILTLISYLLPLKKKKI